MILALLVDPIEQIGCQLFPKAWPRLDSLQGWWEEMRGLVKKFCRRGWQPLSELIYYGIRDIVPEAAQPT